MSLTSADSPAATASAPIRDLQEVFGAQRGPSPALDGSAPPAPPRRRGGLGHPVRSCWPCCWRSASCPLLVAGFFGYRSGSRGADRRRLRPADLGARRPAHARSARFFTGHEPLGRAEQPATRPAPQADDRASPRASRSCRRETVSRGRPGRASTATTTTRFLPRLRENVERRRRPPTASCRPRPPQRYLQAKYTAPFDDFDEAIAATTPATAAPGRRRTRSTTTSSAGRRAERLRGRHAHRHRGQRRLHRVQGRRPRHQPARPGPTRTARLAGGLPARSCAPTPSTPSRSPTSSPTPPSTTRRPPSALSPIGDRRQARSACSSSSSRSTRINNIMTGDEAVGRRRARATPARPSWSAPTSTMRSTSRLLLEDPAAYRAAAVDERHPAGARRPRSSRQQNPILRQPVDTESVDRGAARARPARSSRRDYLGARC